MTTVGTKHPTRSRRLQRAAAHRQDLLAKPVRCVHFPDGIAIRGVFPEEQVITQILEVSGGDLPLVIADPPYGNIVDANWDDVGEDDAAFASWMIDWTTHIERLSCPGAALYVWGGIGRPLFRPFYRYPEPSPQITPKIWLSAA